ncbi:MAG: DNA-binding protein [Spirochaetes bacterium]|nr:DNA-binding protein [Spirochaetota bacterium]
MYHVEKDGLITVRLSKNEDIIQSIKDICSERRVDTAIVFSAVGSVKNFRMSFPNKKEVLSHDFTNVHELLSLCGNFSRSTDKMDYFFHLYAVISDKNKKTFGGQLLRAVAHSECEITLQNIRFRMESGRKEYTGQAVDYPTTEKMFLMH